MMVWIKTIAANIGAEKIKQLLDRVSCRIFHKQYHVRKEALHGWQFVYCNKCKRTWPQRTGEENTP